MISEVRNIDCMEGMKEFPDKFFDLAIVDPPYFSGPERKKYYGKNVSTYGVKRIKYDEIQRADWGVPGTDYFEELIRISKHQIIWGVNYYDYKFEGTGRIVWDKVNDHSTYSDCEIAYCSLIDHVRIFRFMWSGMMQGIGDGTSKKMQGDKSKNEKRIHQTQKPIILYKWLLTKFARPGSKILDTHLGSGSSRIAAFDYRFDFWGYEKNIKMYSKQETRFQNHISQQQIEFNL